MPTPLPVKTLVKVRRARWPIEAFEITSVLIGAAAVSLASFVYWAGHDESGASLILLATAATLAVIMHGTRDVNGNRM